MNGFELTRENISDLKSQVIVDGKIVIHSSEFYHRVGLNKTLLLMLEAGIYVLPTTELIQWLKDNIVGTAIEIGCGNGAIGRALGIPFSDSKMQQRPDIAMIYAMMGQPPIIYPDDVETLEASDAIHKYQPNTVIGGFITMRWDGHTGNPYGVDTLGIVQSGIKYMMIGNTITHKDNPEMKLPHIEHSFDWLIARVANQGANRIFVWNG